MDSPPPYLSHPRYTAFSDKKGPDKRTLYFNFETKVKTVKNLTKKKNV